MTSSESSDLRLAFWAKNMLSIRAARMDWPGFSYTDDEWARMQRLAAPIGAKAYQAFVLVNAVIFIAIAALAIAAVFLPLASWLFPVPAETSALEFTLLLAATALLTIGIGLPISMALAARLCASEEVKRGTILQPGDDVLAAKVSWQINRITLIMCGLLVPGVLLFIAYDIEAGPILTVLKWLAVAAMAFSTITAARRRP